MADNGGRRSNHAYGPKVPMRPPRRTTSSGIGLASSDGLNESENTRGSNRLFRKGLTAMLAVVVPVAIIDVYWWHAHSLHLHRTEIGNPRSGIRKKEGSVSPVSPSVRRVREKIKYAPVSALKDDAVEKHFINTTEDKLRVRQLLQQAGIAVDSDLEMKLPLWSSFVSQYGSEPVVHGLETCEEFRTAVPPKRRYVAPAGMFNTGTNLMARLLMYNCDFSLGQQLIGASAGIRLQVPWGKHNPASWRFRNVASSQGAGVPQGDVLPIVMVKDPYHWMLSMCRHHYVAMWRHDPQRCAELGPSILSHDNQGRERLHRVRVRFKPPHNFTTHESLPALWNDWYGWYEETTYPKLIVRFEDLLLHTEPILRKVCECGGGTLNTKLRFMEGSAKGGVEGHKGANGLVDALVRYGSATRRLEGYSDAELKYAARTLSKERMGHYGYVQPPFS